MFVALWEYKVKPGCEKRFEKVYGREGDWAKLFRSDPNYHETRLVHDSTHPAIYLTLDFWTSRQAYEKFMASYAAEYKRLDAAAGKLRFGSGGLGGLRSWHEEQGFEAEES